jgi:hypothetical protein
MNKEKAEMLSTIIDLEHSLRYYQGQVERQAPVIEAAKVWRAEKWNIFQAQRLDAAVNALEKAEGKP